MQECSVVIAGCNLFSVWEVCVLFCLPGIRDKVRGGGQHLGSTVSPAQECAIYTV